jgi:23S rRNA pseudouridine1911/1915/1917 synthase
MNTQTEFVVPESLDGERLDKALAKLAAGLSRAKVKRAIEAKAVRVNGRARAKGALVATGDRIAIDPALALEDTPAAPSPEAPLDVRFESESVVVVEKPPGQATAPLKPNETGTLANAIAGHFPEVVGVGPNAREPGLIHRLDGDTSGLVVVARTEQAFETLKAALKEGRLEKSYLLVCSQEGLAELGTIEFPIAPHPKDQRRVYPCVHPRDVMRYAPRPASTSYKVKQRGPKWALVEVRVAKAARHQIRAHFAAIEHPLAGDVLYGGEAVPGLGRHALHASQVKFSGGEGVGAFEVRSPLPADLAALLR